LLQVPSNQELLNYFSPAPDPQYALYWSFANVQQLLERSLLGTALDAGAADIQATFKPFPWPAVKIDLGGSSLHCFGRSDTICRLPMPSVMPEGDVRSRGLVHR
jgi:hypothetical protein